MVYLQKDGDHLLKNNLKCCQRHGYRLEEETSGQEKVGSALGVKVPEDIKVQCCGKWHQDWYFFFSW